MIYSVKITSEDGEIIEIGKDGVEEESSLITDLTVHLDTIDNDSRQKSQAMLAKIILKGSIDEIIKNETRQLFNWAKSLEKSKWYRSLVITVREDMGSQPFRTYQFENVFVVDYLEIYKTESALSESSSDADKDHFELYLTQKEGNFKTIESY